MSKIKQIWNYIFCFTENISVYAAQASFFLVISVIPLMLLVFTLAKPLINLSQYDIIHQINAVMPAEISSLLTDIISDLFDKTASVPVISVSAISALWLASRGIMALNTGLNKVYEVPERNYFYTRMISIGYTLAFAGAIILTLIFIAFGEKIENILMNSSNIILMIIQFLLKGRILIIIIYLTLLFSLAYTFLPKSSNKFCRQLPGAFVSAVAWIGFSYIYSIYINHFSNYSFVYGSLAAIVLMMLWLYFCMNIFLYGARINKILMDYPNKNNFFIK